MQREIALDAWRGLMLVVMAAYHYGGALKAVTYQIFGYVSAAEGFVLLSGVMCGLVYGRYARISARMLYERTWRRAWTIYRYHVAVLLLLLVAVSLTRLMPGDLDVYYARSKLWLFVENPAAGAGLSVLLLLLPSSIGILGLYVVYMALSPFVLTLFERGRAGLVFVASVLLWLFAQLGGSAVLARNLPWHELMYLGDFDVFAWQLLFVTGCFIGWRRMSGRDLLRGLSPRLFYAAVVLALFLFLARRGIIDLGLLPNAGVTSIAKLGWVRLCNVAAVALVIYGIALRYGIELRNRWLALLGSHSLPVFAFHALIIYLIVPVHWRVDRLDTATNVAIGLIFVASLTLPALVHQHVREQRRSRLQPAVTPP